MNRNPSARLRVLQDRRAWLRSRMAAGALTDAPLHTAKQELDALDWVIPIAEQAVVARQAEVRDVDRQRIQEDWRSTARSAARYLLRNDMVEWTRLIARAHPTVAKQLTAEAERCIAEDVRLASGEGVTFP